MARFMTAPISAFLALALTAGPSAQQARDAAPPIQPSGKISGTVVNAETGRAVRFARVLIEGPSGAIDDVTGDDGTFVFDRLRPGSYQLIVMKTGYLDTAYGQIRPGTSTPGKRITLAEKEQIERLVVPVSQGGSISGIVRDDRGEPVFRAAVRVSRWAMRNGLRSLDTVAGTMTDERGRYRMSLLPSRDYIVSVTADEESVPQSKRRPATQAFAPVFYPGALSAGSASLVPLGPGEERSDVDVQLPLVLLGRITGVVLGLDGRPKPNVPVGLTNLALEEERVFGTATDISGRFTFDRVVPGTYSVTAGAGAGGRHTVHLVKNFVLGAEGIDVKVNGVLEKKLRDLKDVAGREAGWEIAMAEGDPKAAGAVTGSVTGEVTVASSNTSDIVLTLEKPRAVAGRVVLDGSAKPMNLRGTIVEIMARSSLGENLSVKVAEDGTFVIENVPPGKYIVGFAGEAPPWTLASAISGGADTLDAFLDVPRDRDVRDLVLTLRDKSSELSGTVTDGAGRAATDRIAVVFPADERLWVAGERRIKAMPLGPDGSYSFEEMRPGSYLVAITEGVENDEWLNPDFLRKLLTAAIPVSIGEGEKKVQNLRIR